MSHKKAAKIQQARDIIDDMIREGTVRERHINDLAMAVVMNIFNQVNFKRGVSEDVLLKRIRSRIEVLLKPKTGHERANGINGYIDVEYDNLENLIYYFMRYRSKLVGIFQDANPRNITPPASPRAASARSPGRSPRRSSTRKSPK